MVNPKKKPKFWRIGAIAYKRLGKKWRKPVGIHSKIRRKEKSRTKMPTIGYRAPKALRGLHPSGYKEILVKNLNDLQKIDKEEEAIKIAQKVGKKKRKEIIKKAEKLKIKILNP